MFRFRRLGLLLGLAGALCGRSASGFYANGRWTVTASDGSTGSIGTPVTVTWSIVPDGTLVLGYGPSNLVAFLDGLYGGGGATVADRPWFPLVSQSFQRWTDLGGLAFVYEPTDDGAALGAFAGALEVRGDVRLAGRFLDGIGGTNAQTGFLDNGDITIDTGDAPYYGSLASNSLNLRNTLMHEIGHALGLGHVDSGSAAFLMEPFSDNSFDGPQMDDIRGLHFLYGDAFERAPGGPNDDFATATSLGPLVAGQPIALGLDSTTGTAVLPTETDFVSIANQSDVDVFSFEIASPSAVSVTLVPTGPNYTERIFGGGGSYQTTQSSRRSKLSLEVYEPGDDAPALVAAASSALLGQPESLADLTLGPGTYYVRITGGPGDVQLYHLALSATPLPAAGDFDLDGVVDGADFLLWQRGADLGGTFGPVELQLWGANYGVVGGGADVVSLAVPEQLGWRQLLTGVVWAASAHRLVRNAQPRAGRSTSLLKTAARLPRMRSTFSRESRVVAERWTARKDESAAASRRPFVEVCHLAPLEFRS